MEKLPESISLIRFPDCDPFNHLNNARYLDYFIIAREDHLLKHYNFNIYAYAAEKGVSWVVRQSQIVYLRPAMLMEEVVIQSTLLHWGEKDLLVEMRMWDKTKTSLKSLLWITFTHVNMKTQRSELHSQELTERFRHLENPLPEPASFEQRVVMVKGKTAAELA
jgi:acyl-CoA thioester hydrolase